MVQASLFTDDVLRRLIGVGQVDVVVGLPTMNHADTIGHALDVVDRGLMRHFPRARTVVVGADGGSTDGTPEIVGAPSSVITAGGAGGLRTRHRLGAAYRGIPGRAGAIKLIFTAADLLQAQAVAIIGPDAPGLAPEWIGALLEPISNQAFDLIAGFDRRHPLERLLVTQLIRPLIRAAYGPHFEQPVLSSFGCSRRFAAACLAADIWDRHPLREGIDVWLAGTALTGDFRPGQTELDLRAGAAAQRPSGGLQEVFAPLVGALFATLDNQATLWIRDAQPGPVPITGGTGRAVSADAPTSVAALGATFSEDVRNLRPVLEQILATDTFASVAAAADNAEGDRVRYEDTLWVTTVYDFVAAHHHGIIDRTHIVQALMPLYLGRVASFLGEHANAPIAETEQHLERLSEEFERQRQYLIGRWQRTQ